MKLVANECANCRRVLGYAVAGAMLVPSFCILCAAEKEVLKEWGHRIDKKEKPIVEVLIDYRATLNRIELTPPKSKP